MRNRYVAVAVVAGSMLAGGAIGVAVFAPNLANAASNPSSPTATVSGTPAPAASAGRFHSNEDPAHEAQETPEREAQEDQESGGAGQTAPSAADSGTAPAS